MPTRPYRLAAATAALAALSACGSVAPTPGTGPASGATVVVLAAASLRAAFTSLGASFEAAHPGVTVRFSFAGSQALAEQLTQGATADVFAAADETTMATVTGAGPVVGGAAPIATNRLAIAVPPDNPARVRTFADLARPGLALVVCAPEVPCGAATVRVGRATGVTLSPVSEEQSVGDVLAKVQAGEADAGLVYATDVLAAGASVHGIAFPEAAAAITTSSIVALDSGTQPALGRAFVALVLGGEGRQVLRAAGFGPPR